MQRFFSTFNYQEAVYILGEVNQEQDSACQNIDDTDNFFTMEVGVYDKQPYCPTV